MTSTDKLIVLPLAAQVRGIIVASINCWELLYMYGVHAIWFSLSLSPRSLLPRHIHACAHTHIILHKCICTFISLVVPVGGTQIVLRLSRCNRSTHPTSIPKVNPVSVIP
jgi:hypothetical protein